MNDLQELADVVAQAIDIATAPLLARIAVLEKRAHVHGRDGRDGKDAEAPDLDLIAAKVVAMIPAPRDGRDGEHGISLAGPQGEPGRDGKDAQAVDLDLVVAKAVALIPAGRDGRDGKDADASEIRSFETKLLSLGSVMTHIETLMRESSVDALVARAAELAAKSVPAPQPGKDGRSVEVTEVRAMVSECVKDAISVLPVPTNGTDGRDGRDGKDIDAKMVETIVAASVERVLSGWERPANGKSVTPDDVAPLIAAEVTKAVAALPAAKDGRGIHAVFIGQDGDLEVTFSDGGRDKVGRVVGAPGKDADMAALAKQISDDIARIPAPKDGLPGKDGKDGADGLGIDDLSVILDDAKGYVLRWANATKTVDKELDFPVERGVYKAGVIYHKSSLVTVRGSWWIATERTADRPGESKAWRMVVKSGRDGRDLRREGGDV